MREIAARYEETRGRSPIVLVDMDEVLCKWDEHFVASHRRVFPHITIADAGRREHFDLFAGLTAELQEATLTVLNEPGFFAEIAPMEGAIDAVAEMRDAGFDVALCTSPWLSNPTCASDKLAWVQRHLGRELMESTIITRDKTLIRGDVLIDDKPQITGRATPEWDLIRFTYHYNRNLPGVRLNNWFEWEPVVGDALTRRLGSSADLV